MSSFACEVCGAQCLDSRGGYTTGCAHYPPDIRNDEDSIVIDRYNDLKVLDQRRKP